MSKSEIYRKRVQNGERPSQDVISPEDLKIIAIGLGYEAVIRGFGVNRVVFLSSYNGKEYVEDVHFDPLTNDSQMVEIRGELKMTVEFIEECGCAGWFAKVKGGKVSEGKTLNLAVCRAAVDYFKGNE